MMPITAAQANQLISGMDQLIAVMNEQARLAKASLAQWYGLGDLMTRWALGEAQVLVLLRARGGYVGERGRPVRIHIDTVLTLDRWLVESEQRMRSASRRQDSAA